MKHETTRFQLINSMISVKFICSEFGPEIPADKLLHNAAEVWDEYVGWDDGIPSPIVSDDNIKIGFLWGNQINSDEDSVSDVMERIVPTDFLSSNTTALEAISLFYESKNHYFYIIEKNDIIGVLFFDDFYKPLGRLAFLSLALEVEELALSICQLPSLRERCWRALPEKRKTKARRLYKEHHGKKLGRTKIENLPLKELIDCTYIDDKAKMIWTCRLVSAKSRRQLLGVFHKLQELRDCCCHPKSTDEIKRLLPREKLIDFIDQANDLRDELKTAHDKKIFDDVFA